MDHNNLTEIQEFFKHQTVFLTGASGYLGTIIAEKLLRTCYDLNRIHILVRAKRGKTPEQRLEDILKNPYFDVLRFEKPLFKSKLNLIQGDLEEKSLGISAQDREILKNDVTCVIHGASNVRFDQPLRQAAYINVRAVSDLLTLAKEMPKLKSYVHISTAYANCPHLEIREEFYDPPITIEKLFALVEAYDDDTLEQMTPRLVGKYHNTYILTKCIGEDLVRKEGANLPLSIIRPALIMPTAEGPFPGWVNSLNGVVGITAGISLGMMRTFCINYDNACALVPSDYVANNVIAAVWSKGANIATPVRRTGKVEFIARKEDNNVAIFNFTGSKKNQVTWEEYVSVLKSMVWKYVSLRSIWYIFFVTTKNVYLYYLLAFFLHKLPAYLIDATLILIRKKPIATNIYQKVDKAIISTNVFRLVNWQFKNDNVDKLWKQMSDEDQEMFNFNMRELDWRTYAHVCAKGSRVYLLNDPLETIPQARRKLLLLMLVHYTLVGIICYFLYRGLYRMTMNFSEAII